MKRRKAARRLTCHIAGIETWILVRRLWAEVFHVSASGTGTVKWQQVSEDLVPVNITCIQDTPECVFHITAYNSQVDKILDVRLVQPGMLISLHIQIIWMLHCCRLRLIFPPREFDEIFCTRNSFNFV